MDSGRSVNDFFAFYLQSETWWQLASSLEPRSGKFYDMHALNIQWLAEKLDFFEVYDIKWGYFEWELHTIKVLLCCTLSYVNKDMTWGFQIS